MLLQYFSLFRLIFCISNKAIIYLQNVVKLVAQLNPYIVGRFMAIFVGYNIHIDAKLCNKCYIHTTDRHVWQEMVKKLSEIRINWISLITLFSEYWAKACWFFH